jgi:PAS domain S-box-containing protein
MERATIKILLIYDYGDRQREVVSTLSHMDIDQFDLTCMCSQQLSRDSLTSSRYDVCLVDSNLEINSLLARIRLLGLIAPIIMFTNDSGTEILEALHHGASDCLIKDQLTAANLEESICAVIDQVRNLESKAEYERCYLGLLENTSDVIYTQDLQGNYTSINRAGERLFGYSREELAIMSFRQIVAPEYADSLKRSFRSMLESRQPMSNEVVIVNRQGERISVYMTHHLIYRDGQPVGVQGVVRDPAAVRSLHPDLWRLKEACS